MKNLKFNHKSLFGILDLFWVVAISIFLVRAAASPTGFTVVRKISPSLTFDEYIQAIGRTNQYRLPGNQGYTIVSLDGFTLNSKFQSIDNNLSPLMVWKNIFEKIFGKKPNKIGHTNQEIQSYVMNKIFRNQKSQLLMHVQLTQFPVSRDNSAPPIQLAHQIATTVTQLQLDGVSIAFEDFNALKNNTASDWLQSLLRQYRKSVQNTNLITVLIIPPTYIGRMQLFRMTDVNSLVDYYVLKYYNTLQPDYISYQSLFQKSQFYKQTSLFQLMRRGDLALDLCRTLIAKPSDATSTWNNQQYIIPQELSNIFIQAYGKIGWFAGYANLYFETDKDSIYVNTVLRQVREHCERLQNCVC